MMGAKLVESEDRANQCKNIKNFINQSVELYSRRLDEFKQQFSELETLKFQSIVDAINRMIIFETN